MAEEGEVLEDQEAQATGERFAGSPGDYKTAVGEIGKFAEKLQAGSPVPEYQKAGEAKLKELFEFDRKLEGQYDPLASQRTAMYGAGVVPNPADAYIPASQYVSSAAGGVGDIFDAIGAYKSLEGSALASALNTIFNFLGMQEDRKKREEDRKWQSAQTALDIIKMTGGEWKDPYTGAIHKIPAPKTTGAEPIIDWESELQNYYGGEVSSGLPRGTYTSPEMEKYLA